MMMVENLRFSPFLSIWVSFEDLARRGFPWNLGYESWLDSTDYPAVKTALWFGQSQRVTVARTDSPAVYA